MQSQVGVNQWWAALTVWAVVNAVNVSQAAGFLSRVRREAWTQTTPSAT